MDTKHPLRNEHAVVFYDSQEELIDAVVSFTAGRQAEAVLIATPQHRIALRAQLPRATEIDAETLLHSFWHDGAIDAAAFAQSVGDIVRSVSQGGRPVQVFCDMVPLLWEQGLAEQAIEVESLWDELEESVPLALLCAYPSSLVLDHNDVHVVNQLTSRHAGECVQAFPGSTQSIRAARQFVAENVGSHPTRDIAVLIASELATNAVQHAASSFVVEVDLRDDAVRVAVRDRSVEGIGVQHEALNHEESGRGLSLVGALSRTWGVRATPRGKVVWAELSA